MTTTALPFLSTAHAKAPDVRGSELRSIDGLDGSAPTFRTIGRPTKDRTQLIEANDSLAYPRTMPNGAVIWPGQLAENYPGVVGVPAGVMMDAGFKVYEQWLCEVRNHRVVRAIVRVLGPAYAIEERPSSPNNKITNAPPSGA